MKKNLNRFKLARLANNITVKDAAFMADTSVPMLKRIESGAANPSLKLLVSLACLYHVSTDYLLSVRDLPELVTGYHSDENTLVSAIKSGMVKSDIEVPIPEEMEDESQSLFLALAHFRNENPNGYIKIEHVKGLEENDSYQVSLYRNESEKKPLRVRNYQACLDENVIAQTLSRHVLDALGEYV